MSEVEGNWPTSLSYGKLFSAARYSKDGCGIDLVFASVEHHMTSQENYLERTS